MSLVVLICLFVCLSVRSSDYLQCNERILNFYQICVSRQGTIYQLNFKVDGDYDQDPGPRIYMKVFSEVLYFIRGLLSLTF